MADSELSFVTTNDLIEEISQRSDAMALMALLKTDDTATSRKLTLQYTGDPWTLVGILTDGLETLRKRLQEA